VVNLAGNVCGIMVIEASSAEEARKRAETMKNCPHLIASGTTSNVVYFISIVPEEKKWWLKYPETNPPKEMDAGKVQVYVIENLAYPEDFGPRFPEKIVEEAPCGVDCRTCRLRKEYDCIGCPATIHWKHARVGT